MLALLNKMAAKYAGPGWHVSIDEAMLSGKLRCVFTRTIKNKPTPHGIRFWCSCDPVTGYLFEIIMNDSMEAWTDPISKKQRYEIRRASISQKIKRAAGRGERVSKGDAKTYGWGLGEVAVMRLAEALPDHTWVYTDRFFTTLKLATELDKDNKWLVGTIKTKFKGFPLKALTRALGTPRSQGNDDSNQNVSYTTCT